jgi:hypothetical protein
MARNGMIFRLLTIIYFVFLLGRVSVYSQDEGLKPEEEKLETKAFSLFKAEKFAEALPLMSQLLSLYPKEE